MAPALHAHGLGYNVVGMIDTKLLRFYFCVR